MRNDREIGVIVSVVVQCSVEVQRISYNSTAADGHDNALYVAG